MIHVTHTSDWHLGAGLFRVESVKALARYMSASFNEGDEVYHLVTGDLTDDGEEAELKLAAEAIRRLERSGQVIPVRGNHDDRMLGIIPTPRAREGFDRHILAPMYGAAYAPPRVISMGPAWTCFACDTMEGMSRPENYDDGARGEMGERQLAELDRALGECDGYKLISLHHHPFDRADMDGGPVWQRLLRTNMCEFKDAGRFLDLVGDHAVDIVCFGHKHCEQQWIGEHGARFMFAAGRFTDPDGEGNLRSLHLNLYEDGRVGWGFDVFASTWGL